MDRNQQQMENSKMCICIGMFHEKQAKLVYVRQNYFVEMTSSVVTVHLKWYKHRINYLRSSIAAHFHQKLKFMR